MKSPELKENAPFQPLTLVSKQHAPARLNLEAIPGRQVTLSSVVPVSVDPPQRTLTDKIYPAKAVES